jgi:hypothetical protein
VLTYIEEFIQPIRDPERSEDRHYVISAIAVAAISVRPPQQQQEQQQQAPITILFDQNPTIQKLFPDFVSPSTSSAEMQVLVQAITTEIVEAAKTSDAGLVDVTLVPILRAPFQCTSQHKHSSPSPDVS